MFNKAIAVLSLSLASSGLGFACQAIDFADATAITSVPYTIDHSGTYYLAQKCTYDGTHGAPAIVVNASEVVLDLNGQSLVASGVAKSPDVGIGILVVNQEDV